MGALPFYGVGAALAVVMVGHWLLTHRMMAVSGRFTALVNRWREGGEAETEAMSQDELVAALAAATEAHFGSGAVAKAAPSEPPAAAPPGAVLAPQRPRTHVIFFGALALGGLLTSLALGSSAPTLVLRSDGFASIFGDGALGWGVCAFGGLLVGFGTRMAGGCTSGHALCGVSRAQPGSLVATATFFAAGIAVSFAMGAF